MIKRKNAMLIFHKVNKFSHQELLDCLENNIGLEIDIRDRLNQIVVCHDAEEVTDKTILLQEIFSIYQKSGSSAILALNIKSCGLHHLLKELLEKYKITNYFVFDMAVPDILNYIKLGIKFYTRESEYETVPSLYEEADGVWLDEFKTHWITENVIMKHINNGKKVAIVSPDLHKRNYSEEWAEYKKIMEKNNLGDKMMICTDFPEKFNL